MSKAALQPKPGEIPHGFWRELKRYAFRNVLLFIVCGSMALIGMMLRAYWLVLVAWLVWMAATYRTGKAFARNVRNAKG